MRITIVLTLVLLLSAFAVAQDTTNPSAAPGSQSPQTQQPGMPSQQPGMPSQRPGTMPDPATSPNPSMDRAPMAGGDVVEGCLGGANPNYTVTDNKGTTYQILVPQGADASPLAKHIGESVQVEGTVDKSGSKSSSSASGSSASSSAKTGSSIHAMRIGRGTSSCPASGGSTTPKPPSK